MKLAVKKNILVAKFYIKSSLPKKRRRSVQPKENEISAETPYLDLIRIVQLLDNAHRMIYDTKLPANTNPMGIVYNED